MTPLFVVFYQLGPGPGWQLIPIRRPGNWALVVNGTFFAAISLRTRSREIMLPLLLFSHFHPGDHRHGQRNHSHFSRENSPRILDRLAGCLRCNVYCGEPGFCLKQSASGMKRAFPISRF